MERAVERARPDAAASVAPATRAAPPARVAIEDVRPRVDDGTHPVKRTIGDRLEVLADVLADGTDALRAVVRHRFAEDGAWIETPMEALGNDRWRATFALERVGLYEWSVIAWVDRFATWRDGLEKKAAAGLDVGNELLEGAGLIHAAARGDGAHAAPVDPRVRTLLDGEARTLASAVPQGERVRRALTPELATVMAALDGREGAGASLLLRVRVDRVRARYGSWYEMFPRSAGTDAARPATLAEAAARLSAIAAMGFDVLYLPPIHPIGITHRKGPNNALVAAPADPGCPWAIGSAEGGHTAVDPALGSLDDFDAFVADARRHGLEVALDLAFQCSPDHPWVREHPEWFRRRADGTIQFAENPPNRFEDIYPFDFASSAWRELWQALRDVALFWAQHGVRVLRVDNPHTKPLPFWEWLIADVQHAYPDMIFLAEAFTRPKIMKRLAKAGFTQTYTYFTWRNTKDELTEYFTELTQTEVREYLRPNLFTNTPDVLHAFLQEGGRPAFQIRLVLAATLGASYGIYGPVFELCEERAHPGTEEYVDSEKYQVQVWDHDRPESIRDLVTRVNRARRAHPALHRDERLRFHAIDDPHLLCYSKTSMDLADVVLTVVNLDPHRAHDGWVELALEELGIGADETYEVDDALTGARWEWRGARNWVRLDPAVIPAHVLVVRRPQGGQAA
ncbi:MAG TPA: alpha-1,4-glucan--maltose-1-phosphate maltosyltransferase [Candidatus Binatia bacterium]|jgi:starch synthase (maltosyl-transferring)